MYSVQNDTEL